MYFRFDSENELEPVWKFLQHHKTDNVGNVCITGRKKKHHKNFTSIVIRSRMLTSV